MYKGDLIYSNKTITDIPMRFTGTNNVPAASKFSFEDDATPRIGSSINSCAKMNDSNNAELNVCVLPVQVRVFSPASQLYCT